MKSILALTFSIVLIVSLSSGCEAQRATPDSVEPNNVQAIDLGQIRNLKCIDKLFCSGQFTQADLPLIKAEQFQRIISLRAETEIDWNEKAAVEESEIEFLQIPIAGPTALTDEVFDRVRTELKKSEKKTLLHCGVGGRVAAAWLPYRVLDQGIAIEQALQEAQALGLGHPGMRDAAVAYITREQAQMPVAKSTTAAGQEPEQKKQEPATQDNADEEKSVKPGINDTFLDENLKVDEYVERFEMESREIFVAREKILAACKLEKGMSVADIGAGTGLFSRMFSVAVGDQGWVYAVDIAPRFLEHINKESQRFGLPNITAVLGTDKSPALPAASVDAIFICDTYHHFEYPTPTLKAIRVGLKPGGRLIIVDFERIPGVSREWTLNHVRAGKEVVRQEIETAGFEFVEELDIPGLEENYFLLFRKPEN